jgi:hypothetical protein
MQRRRLLWILLLPVGLLALWGIGEAFDRRPNPIVVHVGPRESGLLPLPAPAVPASVTGIPFVEVEVTRERPLRMKVVEMPVISGPGPTGETMPSADPDALAAEEKALRAALDAWLAVPGRGLRLGECWTGGGFERGWLGGAWRVRVVLNARLLRVADGGGGAGR